MTSKKKPVRKTNKSAKKPRTRGTKTSKTIRAKAAVKKPRIAVLIADDHSVVREGLASLIARKPDMTVVGEASNGREAVDLWKQCRPDVTLLDLRMPELDGVGTIKEIRAGDENARIIDLQHSTAMKISTAPFKPARRAIFSRTCLARR